MNHPLLQKASIVLSPTGYAEDFLHSIKPAQSFGSELVPNGTFDSGISGWVQNGGAVLSYISANNSLQSVSTSGGKGAVLTASITVTVGKKYIVKAECVSVTGTCNLRIGTSTTGSQYLETSAVSIPTIFEHRITATSTSLYVYLRNASASTTQWDNISIREVTDADFDFTRATTATRVNESRLIETVAIDTPRINYTIGVTENKGHLLLEPSSTNLVTYSVDLSNAFWTKFNTTVATNDTTSPDGTVTANKITSSGTFANINRTFTKSASALSYTQSAFVKTSGYDLFNFIAYGSSSANRAQVTFSLTNGNIDTAAIAVGSFTSASATIIAYPNDWYKITLSYTTDTSTEVKYYLQFPIEMSTNFIYLWGAQLEQLPYCTSYIPTSGATVTRNADAPSTTGNSDLINASEGVLYFETIAFDDISALRLITIESADNNNRVSIGYSNTSNAVRVIIRVNGSNVVNQNLTVSNLTNANKFAFKYKTDASSIFLNGSEVLDLSSTSFTFSQSLTSLNLDGGAGTNNFYGKVKVLAVFKEVLTDAELTTLTS